MTTRRLVLIVGPLYVDFTTDRMWPPSMVSHPELRPYPDPQHPESPPQWRRKLGGSAWKVAAYWRRQHPEDRVLLVCRLARSWSEQNPAAGDLWRHRPFVDDARWLRYQLNELNKQAGAPPADQPSLRGVEIVPLDADGTAGVDYTFHLSHPDVTERNWPIQTLSGGAAHQLTWSDVVSAWQSAHNESEAYRDRLLILCGIGRTGIVETILDSAGHIRTSDLGPRRPRLILDLGRTDHRSQGPETPTAKPTGGRQPHAPAEASALSTTNLIRQSDVAFVDLATAGALDLLRPEVLPQSALIVRSSLFGSWWLYRRAQWGPRALPGREDASNGKSPPVIDVVVRKNLGAAGSEGADDDGAPGQRPPAAATSRPERMAEVVAGLDWSELSRTDFRVSDEQRDWEHHLHPDRYRHPTDITTDLNLRNLLDAIEFLVRAEAISQLLIYGPTGTGKEIIAAWVHHVKQEMENERAIAQTPRERPKTIPRAVVAAGNMTETLVASELFGHKKGAFTGADSDRTGAFRDAAGGVLQLDDLDTIDERVQEKLLRAVDDGWVQPVGSSEVFKIDVFLICTTNKRPAELVKAGKFREDLYYRLTKDGIYLELPPLAKRPNDALQAAEQEWKRCIRRTGEALPWPEGFRESIAQEALPGNFRQVRSLTRHRYLNDLLRSHGLPTKILGEPPAVKAPAASQSDLLQWLATQTPPKSTNLKELMSSFLEHCQQFARREGRNEAPTFTANEVIEWIRAVGPKKKHAEERIRDELKSRIDQDIRQIGSGPNTAYQIISPIP
jgi:transcriptional regulator with AAA-type ATPase domain